MKKQFFSYLSCHPVIALPRIHKCVWLVLILLLYSFIQPETGLSQGVIPTKGKDFWIGFPVNPDFSPSTKRCEVFVTSDVSTVGTISIPQQGYFQVFNVTANQTTT